VVGGAPVVVRRCNRTGSVPLSLWLSGGCVACPRTLAVQPSQIAPRALITAFPCFRPAGCRCQVADLAAVLFAFPLLKIERSEEMLFFKIFLKALKALRPHKLLIIKRLQLHKPTDSYH
jgi:hypothetical protein